MHLAAAIAKIGQWQPPMRLNETTREFFARLAKISPPEEAFLYQHLEDPVHGPVVQEKLRASNVTYNAMLRTTLSPNIIKGGFRVNVIPGDALATVDVRTLPDEDFEKFLQTLRDLINDPAVEVVSASSGKARPKAPPSKLDSELFHALERAQQRMFPDAVTIPILLTGATDSAQLRAKGVQAYGIGSVMTDEESARFHGNDERLSVAGIRKFLEFMWLAVVDVAATR